MSAPRTLFDKIWDAHAVQTDDQGQTLLYIDRCYIHEGARHAFDVMHQQGQSVARPAQVFGFADHYVPTIGRDLGLNGVLDPANRAMIELLEANAKRHGFALYGISHPDQGIAHIVPPEQGLTQPGMVIVGADSHTSTHGALGALAVGVGASDTRHVLVTQTLWQTKPGNFRITVNGVLPLGCTAKDLILAIIAKIGAGGGVGYAIEYAGEAIEALSMEGRMTVCNMSIEAGARAGMIAPDEVTFDYLRDRPLAPKGAMADTAFEYWRSLPSDDGAIFDKEVVLDAGELSPMVTWGTSPEHAVRADGCVPSLDAASSAEQASDWTAAMDYMGLKAGQDIGSVPVDRVFIGSCTNGRIEDLRAAASVAQLGTAQVPTWVVPGSMAVKRQAEAEGLHEIFTRAGFEWRAPGCSMCTAINGEELVPGERCASTSNRNFQSRQGREGRTHLLSPAMAAKAAITGQLAAELVGTVKEES